MALSIRMKRMGTKNKAFFRIVVADKKSPRDGRFVEEIGYYHPLKKEGTVSFNKERVQHWLGVGAQPSETVRVLLKKEGLLTS